MFVIFEIFHCVFNFVPESDKVDDDCIHSSKLQIDNFIENLIMISLVSN